MEATADWVVVGSGPAGCAFAGSMGRLAPKSEVIVLESGDDAPTKSTSVSGFPANLTDRAHFELLPQGAFKECVVHGRVDCVGGGSAMNAGAFVEDRAYWCGDWDSLCRKEREGKNDWSSEAMESATKRVVEALGGLRLQDDMHIQSFASAIASGGEDVQILSDQCLTSLPVHYSVVVGRPATCFTPQGDRLAATQLLRGCDKIRLIKNTAVRRLVFDQSGCFAIGIETMDGRTYVARRGVVVAAGPEATALLLFRSGLQNAGIGLGFRDHPTISWPVLSFQEMPSSKNTPSYSSFAFFSSPHAKDRRENAFQLSFLGHGMLAGCARLLVLGHKFPRWLRLVASLAIIVTPYLPRYLSVGVIACTVSKPRTTGRFIYDKYNDTLQVQASPLCDEDRTTLKLAVQRGYSVATKMRLWHRLAYYFMSSYIGTLWHASGGAIRGLALESSRLRVKNTSNVYVVGAAAMPQLPAANPMASCYAMGWRLAELLFSDAAASSKWTL